MHKAAAAAAKTMARKGGMPGEKSESECGLSFPPAEQEADRRVRRRTDNDLTYTMSPRGVKGETSSEFRIAHTHTHSFTR